MGGYVTDWQGGWLKLSLDFFNLFIRVVLPNTVQKKIMFKSY